MSSSLPSPIWWHSFYAVSDALTDAVRQAIRRAPCSVAKLAQAARVPQSTLARILAAERNATPAVARAVVRALDEWGARCGQLGESIRQALKGGTDGRN